MRTQRGGVAHGLEWQRMIGHPRNDIQIGDVPARQHQMAVIHFAGLAVIGFKRDLIALEINVLYFLGAAKDCGQELAQRHNDIQRVD